MPVATRDRQVYKVRQKAEEQGWLKSGLVRRVDLDIFMRSGHLNRYGARRISMEVRYTLAGQIRSAHIYRNGTEIRMVRGGQKKLQRVLAELEKKS